MRIVTIKGNDLSKVGELIETGTPQATGTAQTVTTIINQIRDGGDEKLVQLTNQFDRNDLKARNLKVSKKTIESAYKNTDKELIKALELSAKRVEAYYEKQTPHSLIYEDELDVKLGWRWLPIESVGLYVPGGTASYPSSVIMNAIPAKVAGVQRIAMVCPAMDGKLPNIVLAAAHICGIEEIYKIGGAQAVAALAYGTKTVKPVDKIVGPGNAYVAEAKRQVFGKVGIDMIAGPSEILVIADEANNPKWTAADMLSQAEHDPSSRCFLVTDSQKFAQDVVAEIYDTIPDLKRSNIAEKSIEHNGLVIVTENLKQAAKVSNIIAPEHLELAVEDPDDLLPEINNAGAVFLGRYTPEAIGDYIAGPSHVLPTSGSSKFSSGLSIFDFLKRQSIIGCTKKSFKKLAAQTELLANEEGLTAHALSVTIRNGK